MALQIKELLDRFSGAGKVLDIAVRPKRLEQMKKLQAVLAIEEKGLQGDRYNNKGGNRQVTLIQAEHIDAVASYMNVDSLDFAVTRRNILVKGINLHALKDKNFQIGDVVLAYTGECHPCSRMEEALGTGGYNAMRGHGGITAKVITGGELKVGDSVLPV